MVPEIAEFNKWLRRKSPYATTPIHYSNDLKLFFAWLEKAPDQVRVSDIDAYIERCQSQGQAMATINRRLAAIRSFYHFLGLLSDEAPANPVVPKRHFIRQGRRLSISGIQKRLSHYRRQAGLHLSCHQLRHTFGRHLVEAGVPVTTIQRLFGHARLRTTELYLHVSNRQVQADYEAAMQSLAERLERKDGCCDG